MGIAPAELAITRGRLGSYAEDLLESLSRKDQSVNAVTEQASCPINWRLFVPERWAIPPWQSGAPPASSPTAWGTVQGDGSVP